MLIMQRGDTIIEALLAFTVFSLVSVGAMTVMNQATNTSQRALEITLVRQQIDAQAEALRAAQQAFTRTSDPANSQWAEFARSGSANNSIHFTRKDICPSLTTINSSRMFILNPATATYVAGSTWYRDINASTTRPYARVVGAQSYGMWIERTYRPGNTNLPNSYDFTVRACWFGAGMELPMQIETSVRLYEPR